MRKYAEEIHPPSTLYDGSPWGIYDGSPWGIYDGSPWGIYDGSPWGIYNLIQKFFTSFLPYRILTGTSSLRVLYVQLSFLLR